MRETYASDGALNVFRDKRVVVLQNRSAADDSNLTDDCTAYADIFPRLKSVPDTLVSLQDVIHSQRGSVLSL